jgi:NAD(P)-dependent dehydrogenase (short-subunit alcohol dehydrogenase family)
MSALGGKVAIVTGSTRGIGEATARLLAARGASVTVTGRNRSRGQDVAQSIQADGGSALYVAADIGNQADTTALVEQTVQHFGRLDVLVNNAAPTEVMGRQTARLTDVPWDEFDEVMRVGLYGAIWACRSAIPHMQAGRGGSIINISSVAAVQGLPGLASYTCAKGALTALTRQLAVDYASDGIRVNTVVLGIIINELTGGLMKVPGLEHAVRDIHLTRLGENGDVARVVTYLASDDAAFLTGTELRVDGGTSIKGAVPGDAITSGLSAAP